MKINPDQLSQQETEDLLWQFQLVPDVMEVLLVGNVLEELVADGRGWAAIHASNSSSPRSSG